MQEIHFATQLNRWNLKSLNASHLKQRKIQRIKKSIKLGYYCSNNSFPSGSKFKSSTLEKILLLLSWLHLSCKQRYLGSFYLPKNSHWQFVSQCVKIAGEQSDGKSFSYPRFEAEMNFLTCLLTDVVAVFLCFWQYWSLNSGTHIARQALDCLSHSASPCAALALSCHCVPWLCEGFTW
jgi:hypothetical protein